MMTNDHKKRNMVRDPDADIISDLPDNITEAILMYLPTRDAARTCILSSKWRYRWGKLPQLILDTTMCEQSMQDQEPMRVKFAMIICHILALRQGPIIKFTLHIPQLMSCPEVDMLICFISTKGVEDFTLCVSEDDLYRLPSSFFLMTKLRHLNLLGCLMSFPPSTFKGFNKLISLQLVEACITAELLDCLISHCPLLEELSLDCSEILGYLKIKAPKLRTLAISVPFRSKGILNIELFEGLPSLEHLNINCDYIKFWVAGGLSSRLAAPLLNLKVLILSSICLDETDLLSYTLRLIRGSPNLNTITFALSSSVIDNGSSNIKYFEIQEYSGVTFNHLLEVKLKYLTGKKCEMELIKVLLAKSPILKKMTILLNNRHLEDKGLKILKELVQFERASPNARVFVL